MKITARIGDADFSLNTEDAELTLNATAAVERMFNEWLNAATGNVTAQSQIDTLTAKLKLQTDGLSSVVDSSSPV